MWNRKNLFPRLGNIVRSSVGLNAKKRYIQYVKRKSERAADEVRGEVAVKSSD